VDGVGEDSEAARRGRKRRRGGRKRKRGGAQAANGNPATPGRDTSGAATAPGTGDGFVHDEGNAAEPESGRPNLRDEAEPGPGRSGWNAAGPAPGAGGGGFSHRARDAPEPASGTADGVSGGGAAEPDRSEADRRRDAGFDDLE
jgi:hypothetical protein